MSDSVIVNLADAIVTELNADGRFSQAIAAERKYLPVFDLKDMQSLHVTVVPKSVTLQPGSRTQSMFDYAIDVAVQQKVDGTDGAPQQTEIDGLMQLTQEIVDHFRFIRLAVPGVGQMSLLKADNEPAYAPDHLEQMSQFTSVVTLTFRALR